VRQSVLAPDRCFRDGKDEADEKAALRQLERVSYAAEVAGRRVWQLRGIHFSVATQRACEFKRRGLAENGGRSGAVAGENGT